MIKVFKDERGESREPARLICVKGHKSYFESTSIYYTHLIRVEESGKRAYFVYDPGKVYRFNKLYC